MDILELHRSRYSDFGVARLLVFGSRARGTPGPASDIDILVEFTEPTTFDRFIDLKDFLEGLLGLRVDLVTTKALRPELKDAIEREAIRVA
ncbi:MAG TPA: nucleotidyltransferase family protein [Hyphomicrobiaceae bacterium]|nr:nucleotidyltransferase family protein [Hyphomicrobiaceae bacterium]